VNRSYLLGGLTTTLGFFIFSGALLAQDPVKVAPSNYKMIFENDSVRVCEVKCKPGEKIATHSHPDHVVYSVTDNKVKFTYPDGKTKEVNMKPGTASWIKAETHAGENVGSADLKVIVFELKKSAPTGTTPAKTPEAEDPTKVAADSTKVLLDNERVRLLEVRTKAGGKVPKHTHPASLVYALTDGKFKITTYPEGKTEEKTLTAGQVVWNEPTTHAAESLGTSDTDNLVLELKDHPKSAGK